MSFRKRSIHSQQRAKENTQRNQELKEQLAHVTSWFGWKQHYQDLLANDKYGYETKFIDLVLSKVDNIQPNHVHYQYHFKQANGKNRFIDFLILNQEKGYCLAIELDGYGKMLGNSTGDNKDYDKFNDFMVRQNSLLKALYNHNETSKFNIIILRYTNKYFLNNTYSVIHEIVNTLYLQANLYSSRLVIKKDTTNYEQQVNMYQHDIIYYKEKTNDLNELVVSKDNHIKELEIQIAYYQHQLENNVSEVTPEKGEVNNSSIDNLFEPSEIILDVGQGDEIKDDNSENLTEKDLLIEKLKSENAKLKWIEMKYKELTETKEVTQKEPVATTNVVVSDIEKPVTNDDGYKIVFTQQEKLALAEVFGNNNDEIDWEATRKALSKQPNRLKKKEKQEDSNDDNFFTILGKIIIALVMIVLVVVGLGEYSNKLTSVNQEKKSSEVVTYVDTNKDDEIAVGEESAIAKPTNELVNTQPMPTVSANNTNSDVEVKENQSTEYSLAVKKTKQQYEEIHQKPNQNEVNSVAQIEKQLELEKQKLDNQTKDIDNVVKQKEYQIDLLERYLVKRELASNDTVQSNQQDDKSIQIQQDKVNQSKKIEIPMEIEIPTE